MSEEEKQAIEYLERHIIPYCREGKIKFMLNEVILNLIKKQQKELILAQDKAQDKAQDEELIDRLNKENQIIFETMQEKYISKDKIREFMKDYQEGDMVEITGVCKFLLGE